MERPTLWYVNVFVSDLARSVEFYREVLGLELLYADREHGYAGLEASPIRLGLAEVAKDSAEFSQLVGRHTGVGLAQAAGISVFGFLLLRGAASLSRAKGGRIPSVGESTVSGRSR